MKEIKFVSQDTKEKQFADALRNNVYAYFKEKGISTKGNSALVLQTIIMLCLYFVPYLLLLTIPMHVLPAIFMCVLTGIGMAGIGMCVMHDAVHGSYSSKAWVNKLLGATMYLLGSNVLNWKIQHNILHHGFTNIEGYDRDIGTRGPLRLSAYAPLNKVHKYQYIHAFFFYGLMTISKLSKEFNQLIEFYKAGLINKTAQNLKLELLRMGIVKAIYLFIFIGLPILFTSYSWWQIGLGFFIMHWTAGIIMSTVFQMAHVVEGAQQIMPSDGGVIPVDWTVHELRTTSDFARNNLFLNWFAGGLNFQIEHHLFPNICHIHYKNIAPIVEKTVKEFGFVYNLKPSFRSAILSHVRRLKELGKKLPS